MKMGKYLLRATLAAIVASGSLWFWLLHTESGAAWAWLRVNSAMTGQLTGQFEGGDFANGIRLKDIRFSNDTVAVIVKSAHATIDIDAFPLTVQLSDVSLVKTSIEQKPSGPETGPELDIESVLSGLRLPLRLDLVDANLTDVEVLMAAGESLSISRIDTSVIWHNSVTIRSLKIEKGEDSVVVRGEIGLVKPQSFELSVGADVQDIVAQAEISGDHRSAVVHSIDVNGADIEASGTMNMRWNQGLVGQGSIQLDRLNPNAMVEIWPATHPVSGRLALELTNDVIRVSEASLAVANANASLLFDADLDRTSSMISANLHWLNMQWPVDAATPSIRSAEGVVSVSGDLDQWTIDGLVAVGAEAMADGQFQISGGGDRDEVALNIENGLVFGGSINGDVGYSWRGEQNWSASVTFEDIRTAGLLPAWPGVVTGRARAEGTQVPFAITAVLEDVAGEIGGQTLAASGGIKYSNDVARADGLSIAHGGSRLLLNGSADSEEGLAFEGSVDAIENYLQDVAGGVAMHGRVSRLETSPYLSVDLTSEELLIGDVLLQGVSITDTRAEDAIAGVSINIEQLTAAGQNVMAIEALADIRSDRQSLRVTGSNRDTDIVIAVDGAFDDLQRLLESPWRGTVNEFSIDLNDAHTLRLEQPASIKVSRERVALEGFCLADEVASYLCLDLAQEAGTDYALEAELVDVPLALIEHVMDARVNFDQRVNGTVAWHGNPDAGATGTGRLELSAGTVSDNQGRRFSFPTGVGKLAFEINNGDLLSGTATIPFPGIGGIAADFRVLELTDVANSDLSGHLNINMNDVAIIALLIPQIDSAGGRMDANLELAGTGSDPLLTGKFAWQEGVLEYGPIGLRLEDIDLVSNLGEDRSIDLSGSFRSGDGRGEIISSAEYGDEEEPGLHFKIRGDDLLLVNVPDIQLSARPDFTIDYNKQTLTINGSLHIPTAVVSPSNLAEGRVEESDDVVIVAGEVLEEAVIEKGDRKLRYEGQLEITLGENVVIDLDIAKAKLSGGAVYSWSGLPLPKVTGRYDLQGSVQVFGQVLDITEGVVRYSNAVATEPQLRIKAEREIYGNSQVKRAGVLIDGSASHPTIHAYTYPLTTEERALTLLVTGSDFDLEQGVGAIDFGTYIAPKLFVSYGVGIFDQENIISARYDLAKGFGIKVSSGDQQSGLDLNYKFEN